MQRQGTKTLKDTWVGLWLSVAEDTLPRDHIDDKRPTTKWYWKLGVYHRVLSIIGEKVRLGGVDTPAPALPACTESWPNTGLQPERTHRQTEAGAWGRDPSIKARYLT